MRIDGAGGCFDNRIYEIDAKIAWGIMLLCVNEMGVTIDNQDDENFLIDCHNHDKIIRISAQEIDSETTQVIIDARKSRLQVYSWKREDIEVNLFYELFEKKLCEYKAFILCPGCSAKVSSLAKFCPECGIPLK